MDPPDGTPDDNDYAFNPTTPNVDVVLRSSDLADFFVHKTTLVQDSPVFARLFQKQPWGEMDGLPVFLIQHSTGEILELLLFFTYPPDLQYPTIDTLDKFEATAILADEYKMAAVDRRIETAFVNSSFINDQPVASYAIAVQRMWIRAMEVAAVAFLALDARGWPPVEELRDISAAQLHALLHYHHRCGKALAKTLGTSVRIVVTGVEAQGLDMSWLPSEKWASLCYLGWWRNPLPPYQCQCQNFVLVQGASNSCYWIHAWVPEYLRQLGNVLFHRPGQSSGKSVPKKRSHSQRKLADAFSHPNLCTNR